MTDRSETPDRSSGRRWDASSYLHRDGRLSLQDFERFFHSGVDRYVRSLERLAQEVTLEERGTLPTVVPERGRDGGATSAEPISRGLSVEEGRLRSRGSNVGIEERLPSRTSRNSEGGFRPRRVSVSAASQSVATMKRECCIT